MIESNISSARRLPLYDQAPSSTETSIKDQLNEFERAERVRLGLQQPSYYLESMLSGAFTRKERDTVTLLVGGLTLAHDRLVEGAFSGLGYKVLALDCPDQESLRAGKEFGNRGQCNPTYFTVGNLIKYLQKLRDEQGLSPEEIIAQNVFLTAGACGPCRFGMYVTEYRKALRDAGFDGFRVLLFQQQGGLKQATGKDLGLEMNPRFFIALLKALLAGDVINALGYRLRPYEEESGATNRAIEEAKRLCYEALHERRSVLRALLRARKHFARVKVNRSEPKPKVSIIGEFWAMTTEGDGNYHLQKFIEAEGGEVDIQVITAWLLYNIWEVRFDTEQRMLLRGTDTGHRGLSHLGEFGVAKRLFLLWAAEKALRCAFASYATVLGLKRYPLPNMQEIAELAAPYYNNDLRGGEGHMEVGKLIYNALHHKSTMTLSVKPFGCMPSSGVSDGVQSLVTERYPEMLFCAVETSGDGAVNFQSRIQMYLFKAKQAAQREHEQALQEVGKTQTELEECLRQQPRHAQALSYFPTVYRTTSANLIHAIFAALPKGTGSLVTWRRQIQASRVTLLKHIRKLLTGTPSDNPTGTVPVTIKPFEIPTARPRERAA